ncbi:MAG: hypothetical protein A3C58_03290 [Candidatus Staskawiczbacteria bacterium RIFCSPHIGHO2_02_FULL_34_10]|uniref:Fucosyltransferase C-terminal domain-containing protein n=2 Tax=Candidatus Staskawicziibacteriota TaxID=1817916 RepID=A0A1G2HJM1_9BACT|nr:MAG: hypothetical protein A2639_00615 [Candidatus Staskawiczbacteria bacterium RIFCSPHIGHO2_01_FULL_34_27]OGZ67417.1 MAG: hypothetical protein A3C58_03290 [Candidatus Staskawiczbacteria bacterium RIFCSPHIGHO2_02_FULL_34_10]
MYIGFYSYHNLYNNNRLLTDSSSPIGDNLNYPFVLLAQRLKEMGHSVATLDTDDIRKFDAIIFVEFPGRSNPYFKKTIQNNFKNLYLLILESPIIKLDNYIKENHTYFKKIFTWSDELVDNKKYFKIQYSHNIPTEFNFGLEKKEKLCTIISSNKNRHHPKELYSERIKAIRWFESNHPENFDLYGNGWDRYHFEGTFLGIKIARLNRLKFLTKLLRPYYPSYRGSIKSKKETYQKYKFAVCYENTQADGYVTEKIFDCFLAGCVPIYLGAHNITNHIPANTFIDKRKFDTYEKLYNYIMHMPEKEYLNYLNAIKNFLKNDKAYPFSAEYFANTIIEQII